MPAEHGNARVRVEPKLSACEMLKNLRDQIYVTELVIKAEREAMKEGLGPQPRDFLDGSINVYVAKVQRTLLIQMWQDATGEEWVQVGPE